MVVSFGAHVSLVWGLSESLRGQGVGREGSPGGTVSETEFTRQVPKADPSGSFGRERAAAGADPLDAVRWDFRQVPGSPRTPTPQGRIHSAPPPLHPQSRGERVRHSRAAPVTRAQSPESQTHAPTRLILVFFWLDLRSVPSTLPLPRRARSSALLSACISQQGAGT